MGILNVTPDSCSDGGFFFSKENAIKHAFELIDQGADIIDIGGESSRPGANTVSTEEELRRVIPVIEELTASSDITVSVDTTKPEVAERALDAGATMINDICGMRDERMVDAAVSRQCQIVIMHMYGTPKTLAVEHMGADFMNDIKKFIDDRIEYVLDAGVKKDNIIVDPGIGFGKTHHQNMEIINNSGWFGNGYPVMIGPSRKRFLAECFPDTDSDEAVAKISKIAADNGADIIRTHNVAKTRSAFL